jgi:hypothetical protein
MSNHKQHERKTETTNYASRLLSRMLDDRKRPHERAAVQDANDSTKRGHEHKEDRRVQAK